MTVDPSILLASRVLGVLLFGTAVAGKLRHRAAFVGVVANYRLVPDALAAPAAGLVIGLELLVVAALLSGVGLAAGAGLAVLLLLGFALAMAINLGRGRREIDCGCFQSALRQRLSWALVARNLVLAALLLPLVGGGEVPVTALGLVDGLGAGLALYLLYLVLDQLVALAAAAAHSRRRLG